MFDVLLKVTVLMVPGCYEMEGTFLTSLKSLTQDVSYARNAKKTVVLIVELGGQ